MPVELVSSIEETGRYQFVGLPKSQNGKTLPWCSENIVTRMPYRVPFTKEELMVSISTRVGIRRNRMATRFGFSECEYLGDISTGMHFITTHDGEYACTSHYRKLGGNHTGDDENDQKVDILRFRKINAHQELEAAKIFIIVPDLKIGETNLELHLRRFGIRAWGGFVDFSEEVPGSVESEVIRFLNDKARVRHFKFQRIG